MYRIVIKKGTNVQQWKKNNSMDRKWVTLLADVETESKYVYGAYIYKIGKQMYSVPASMIEN